MQINNDKNGVRIGPSEMGELKEIIAPTYRFTSGARVRREIIRAILTLRPLKFNNSSLNFTLIQQELVSNERLESLFLSQWC
jgi:hypothetical protein